MSLLMDATAAAFRARSEQPRRPAWLLIDATAMSSRWRNGQQPLPSRPHAGPSGMGVSPTSADDSVTVPSSST